MRAAAAPPTGAQTQLGRITRLVEEAGPETSSICASKTPWIWGARALSALSLADLPMAIDR